VVLYDTAPAASLGGLEDALRSGRLDAVLLYSPRSAKIWRGLVEAAGLAAAASAVRHLCLSRNVAAALPEGWTTAVSASPDEAAILELLEQSGRTL
jgi:uroporphyrinogen-III synthase